MILEIKEKEEKIKKKEKKKKERKKDGEVETYPTEGVLLKVTGVKSRQGVVLCLKCH